MQSFPIVTTLYAVLVATACSASSLGYPVFGTKRFTRANLLPPSDYGSSLSMPVYSPIIPQQQQQQQQQYYDSQPQYMPQYAPSDYYDDSGYYGGNTNSYYYVPPVVHRRHQRHDRYPSFGLPTYRGEYKPTPYYYAHAPSYSYSDDRESNNPLDDLHEEMLQEDERERAREYMPVGTEQWYENLPPRHAPDSTFLRNLIMYNQQMNALRNKQQLDSAEEYDEYDESEPEYYDLNPSYVDNRNNYNAFVNPYTGSSNTPLSSGSTNNNRNTFNKISSLRNSMAKNAVEDDEEVQELKSLIHQQKNSRLQQQQPLQQQPQQEQYQVHTPNPMPDMKQQQQRSVANDYSQFNMDSFQKDSPQQQQQPLQYNNYEYENEYDDSWSHWDRKRNVQPKKVTPTTTTTTTTAPPSTTSPKPIVEIIHGHNGQKEVVLPRPASPVRNPFANVNLGKLHKAQQQAAAAASSDANVIAAAPPAGKSATKPGSVYDTIKKIISMQQNLEDAELSHQLDSQKHQGRLQKRFVASAESLVQQLDGLKRTA